MIHVEIECPLCFSDEAVPVCHYCGGTARVYDGLALRLMITNDWVSLHKDCEERENEQKDDRKMEVHRTYSP